MGQTAHLSDDRLVEVCLEQPPTAVEDAHLAGCGRCSGRRSRLASMLGEVHAAADAEIDALFPPDRLEAQQHRILQRIEQDGRPARVITFPAPSVPEMRPLRTRPAGRWIAGAAAAGLAIGLLAGHLAHDLPTSGRPARAPALQNARSGVAVSETGLRAVNASFNEEEFLVELESALDGPHLAVLRPLNELTP